MEIYVRLHTGRTVVLDDSAHDTLTDLKRQLAEHQADNLPNISVSVADSLFSFFSSFPVHSHSSFNSTSKHSTPMPTIAILRTQEPALDSSATTEISLASDILQKVDACISS